LAELARRTSFFQKGNINAVLHKLGDDPGTERDRAILLAVQMKRSLKIAKASGSMLFLLRVGVSECATKFSNLCTGELSGHSQSDFGMRLVLVRAHPTDPLKPMDVVTIRHAPQFNRLSA
jgi:hypothetical protein